MEIKLKTLEIDKDRVLEAMQGFNTEDSERASDAGESRQRIGQFLEETSLNNKVFSHCRMVLRMKKDDKRQDWLRSMKAMLPLMEEQIAANGTKDAFDVPADAMAQAAEPQSDEAFGDGPGDTDGADTVDPEIASEADEFAAAADAVYGGEVKKFTPRQVAAQ